MDASNVTEPDTRKRNPIFIEDFIDIDRPFYALQDRFSGDGQWLAPLATEATRDGESLRMRIGPEWAEQLVTHEVHVTLWPPRERDSSLVRSLTWVPSGWQSLFPLLDGGSHQQPAIAQQGVDDVEQSPAQLGIGYREVAGADPGVQQGGLKQVRHQFLRYVVEEVAIECRARRIEFLQSESHIPIHPLD